MVRVFLSQTFSVMTQNQLLFWAQMNIALSLAATYLTTFQTKTTPSVELLLEILFRRFLFSFREGDLRVIRPLVYVREKELRVFAEKVTADMC